MSLNFCLHLLNFGLHPESPTWWQKDTARGCLHEEAGLKVVLDIQMTSA